MENLDIIYGLKLILERVKRMGKLFILMGKSATGKDTIFKELVKNKHFPLNIVIPYTTRPIREGEKNGVEYFFVSNEEYHRFEKEKKIIESREYNTVHGIWRYFTVYDQQINLDKKNYIMINTLEGYRQIRDYFGGNAVVPIYIQVEDGLRLTRALQREREQKEPKYAELCRRFLADAEDFSQEKLRNAGIETYYENIEISYCIKEILEAIKICWE